MSLNYGSVRLFQNGEPIDEAVLNRPIEDLAKAIDSQMYNKTEVDAHKWHADSVNAGVLHKSRVGNISTADESAADVVPVLYQGGNSTPAWRPFSWLLAKYANQIGASGYAWQGNIYTSPTVNNLGRKQGLQIVAATHVNAPVGMMVGYRTTYTTSWGTGNGTATRRHVGTFLAFKITSTQWYSIALDAPTGSQTTDNRYD